MKNRNYLYAAAYARKTLKQKKSEKTIKPIDKHGSYDGTDVGFTSDSIEKPEKTSRTKQKMRKKPIDNHSNYEGTDVGFTAKFSK